MGEEIKKCEELKEEVKEETAADVGKDYTYRFEELVDEMEASLKKLNDAIAANERIRMKLVEAGLDQDDDFKEIMESMKKMHDNYCKQLPILQERIAAGHEYLDCVKENNPDNETTKYRVGILMDFLGIFAK